MPPTHIRTWLSLALAVAVLSGHIVDQTTDQPLVGVKITLSGASKAVATTDRNGRFRLTGLKPGTYTLTMESNDVPPQTSSVRLRSGEIRAVDLKLCSTTLDYHCGPASPGGG